MTLFVAESVASIFNIEFGVIFSRREAKIKTFQYFEKEVYLTPTVMNKIDITSFIFFYSSKTNNCTYLYFI